MSLPPLPAEIWRAILRLSVEIPRSLDTKWDYSPDAVLWHHWEQSDYYTPKSERNRDYYSALKTKLSIVQVSRTWLEFGLELLYEHLLFADEHEDVKDVEEIFRPMAMVASIFERHANEPGFTYGWATKRVDVPLSALSHPILPILIRLLNFCHNLRVFIIGKGGVYRIVRYNGTGLSDLTSLLQTRFSHSLRRLSFNLERMAFNQNDIKRFKIAPNKPIEYYIHLPNLPLDSLEFDSRSTSPSQSLVTTTVSVLTIHALYSPQHMAWHFPALRHLTLINVTHTLVDSHLSFLISHGPQLISLAVFFLARPRNKLGCLSRLIAAATNLRSLVFDLYHTSELLEKDIFPSITHIGARSKPYKAHWEYYSTIHFPTSIFLGLQCIRFLDIANERPGWLLNISRQFKNIRVENRDCQSIL